MLSVNFTIKKQTNQCINTCTKQCTGMTQYNVRCLRCVYYDKELVKESNKSVRCYQHLTSDDECSICFDKLTNSIIETKCKHIFHKCCLQKWLKNNNSCPCCRNIIKKQKISRQIYPTPTIHNLINTRRMLNLAQAQAQAQEHIIQIPFWKKILCLF